MKQDVKDIISLQLSMLKQTLKEEKVVMGVLVDKKNPQDSKVCFLDLESYANGKTDGITVDLTEFNKDIIESEDKP